MTMTINQAIINRRSIRDFNDMPIPKKTIERIIRIGTLAPSVKNIQPWKFAVLKGNAKDSIAHMMLNNRDIGSIHCTAKSIMQASALILIYNRGKELCAKSDIISIGACVQNMCLYATSIGIGTLIIRDTYCVDEQIEKMYCEGLELYCAIAIGYPSAKNTSSHSTRIEAKKLTEWYE